MLQKQKGLFTAKKILLSTLIILFVGEVILLLNQQPTNKNTASFPDSAFVMKWKLEIQKKGTVPAYQKLVKEYNNEQLEVQHFALHRFGELLYEISGIDGFKVCDESY